MSIDLSAVTHIDSSGVATLIEALKIARNCKTELRLQGLHDRLHRLFEATGILSLFNEGIRQMNHVWVRGGLMANLLEIAGRETLSQLDYVGSLNIQLWSHPAWDACGFAPSWKSTSVASSRSPDARDRG